MRTLRELYRTGKGPSSSHTMAPARAADHFLQQHPDSASFRVTLYGSLAATGIGHLTDQAIRETLAPHAVEIVWLPNQSLPLHPNGMRFESLNGAGAVLADTEEYSIGGGALLSDPSETADTFPHGTLTECLAECEVRNETFWEYVTRYDGENILQFLDTARVAMLEAIDRGLSAEGTLPGGLGLNRRAGELLAKSTVLGPDFRSDALLAAYAYAAAEENACGGQVVTAPTCGSCGVLPAILYYLKNTIGSSDLEVSQALATAGLFGTVVKANGSIAGSVVGCQGEIGTACAMAAAAAAQLLGGNPKQIEYAAEMGLEHHLGLTCDPVAGLVQIPCIERNAHAAARALSCAHLALLSDGRHRITFDDAVSVLLETGKALSPTFKETSAGGLARVYRQHGPQQQTD